jgi:signal transduction histidine kinase
VPLAAKWEDGSALAALGGLLLVGTIVAIPRLPDPPMASNIVGLLFSGGGGVAALYAVRRARSESMPPEATAALTRRAVEGGIVLGALVWLLIGLSPDAAERPLANLRAFTGLGVTVGLLIGAKEARAVERGKAADSMRRQREQLDFLTDMLSHDVLNKVAVIRGHAELLAETVDGGGERQQLETVAREAGEIESLVDDVRVLAGSLESADDLEPVALSPLLESEAATVQESYDVTVEMDVDTGLYVRADELLSSLLGNLLRNAAEHGSANPHSQAREDAAEHGSANPHSQPPENPAEHGSANPHSQPRENAAEHGTGRSPDDEAAESVPDVVVTATESDGEVLVRVEDRGPGLPPGPEADLFDPEASGGVGLYIVDTLAERYGGSVRATDADPTGATFVVTLAAASH